MINVLVLWKSFWFIFSCFLLQDVSLYAEISSGIVGVARTVDGLRYQASF